MPDLPVKTLELIDRVEMGDAVAALDLVQLYKPDDIRDLVEFVYPDAPPQPWLFDALCDAFNDWKDTTRDP